jgi:hypothetical protein
VAEQQRASDHERDQPDRCGDRHRGRGGHHAAPAVGGHGNRSAEENEPEHRQEQPEEANVLGGTDGGDPEAALRQLDEAGLEILRDPLGGLRRDRLHRVDHERAHVGDVGIS